MMGNAEKFGNYDFVDGFADMEESKRCLDSLLSESDDIPDDLVDEGDYKCRKNWWQNFVEELESILISRSLNDEILAEIYSFITHYTSEEFQKKERISRTDIDRANEMIGKILSAIEIKKHPR